MIFVYLTNSHFDYSEHFLLLYYSYPNTAFLIPSSLNLPRRESEIIGRKI